MSSYTIPTTIALGIFFVVIAYFLFYFFKKFKIKIDEKLLIGIVPWVIAAAFSRVSEDAGFYPESFFTTTPGLVLVFTAIVIPIILLGKYIENKKGFPLWKTLAICGVIAIIIHLPLFKFTNPQGAGLIFVTFAIILGIIATASKFVKMDNLSFWAVASQLFDASATYIALSQFGYSEQHVLPTFLIDMTGPWIMFPLKLAVIIPVIYLLNKKCDDLELRKFLLITIIVLGLAPGFRDTLRLAAGV